MATVLTFLQTLRAVANSALCRQNKGVLYAYRYKPSRTNPKSVVDSLPAHLPARKRMGATSFIRPQGHRHCAAESHRFVSLHCAGRSQPPAKARTVEDAPNILECPRKAGKYFERTPYREQTHFSQGRRSQQSAGFYRAAIKVLKTFDFIINIVLIL